MFTLRLAVFIVDMGGGANRLKDKGYVSIT